VTAQALGAVGVGDDGAGARVPGMAPLLQAGAAVEGRV
jgi:hypothetical protein